MAFASEQCHSANWQTSSHSVAPLLDTWRRSQQWSPWCPCKALSRRSLWSRPAPAKHSQNNVSIHCYIALFASGQLLNKCSHVGPYRLIFTVLVCFMANIMKPIEDRSSVAETYLGYLLLVYKIAVYTLVNGVIRHQNQEISKQGRITLQWAISPLGICCFWCVITPLTIVYTAVLYINICCFISDFPLR